jgi:hypothetical protein
LETDDDGFDILLCHPCGNPHLNLLCGACNDVTLKDEQFKLGNQCCCRTVMRRQPDFMEQKEWLEETVEGYGFQIFVLSKIPLRVKFY